MNARLRLGVAAYEFLIGLIAFVSARVLRADVSWLQIMLAIVGGAASLIAGVLLWRNRSVGRTLSLIVQALQVPQVAIPGVVQYAVGLGAALTPHVGFIPQALQHSIHFSLRFGSEVSGLYVGINLLALVALILVTKQQHENSPKPNHVVATA